MQELLIHGNQVDAIALSPSGRILASGSGSPQGIRLWDLQRKPVREPIKTLKGHNGQPFAIAFSPDGKTLFATGDGSGGRNYAVTVWNACSGELVHRFGEQVRGSALAVSRDGKTLVAGDRKGNLQLWNLL
nr:hypothetical protein [Oscillatoria sp. FACHB-1406]